MNWSSGLGEECRHQGGVITPQASHSAAHTSHYQGNPDLDSHVCMTQYSMLPQGSQHRACSKVMHESSEKLEADAEQMPELTSCTMFSYTSLNLRPQIVWKRPVPLLEPGKWLFFSICWVISP